MTPWSAFIERVKIKFPIPVELTHTLLCGDVEHVRIKIGPVPDVTRPGRLTPICSVRDLPPFDACDPHRLLLHYVLDGLEHELEETYTFDGERVYNPHANERCPAGYIDRSRQ